MPGGVRGGGREAPLYSILNAVPKVIKSQKNYKKRNICVFFSYGGRCLNQCQSIIKIDITICYEIL
jgi:hypothetical protein